MPLVHRHFSQSSFLLSDVRASVWAAGLGPAPRREQSGPRRQRVQTVGSGTLTSPGTFPGPGLHCPPTVFRPGRLSPASLLSHMQFPPSGLPFLGLRVPAGFHSPGGSSPSPLGLPLHPAPTAVTAMLSMVLSRGGEVLGMLLCLCIPAPGTGGCSVKPEGREGGKETPLLGLETI